MKVKSYVMIVVIGVLILIITSLILKLLSLEVGFLPVWFFENLFLGVFTLAGAFFGATIAGKHAVNSVKEQIESNSKKEDEKSKKTITIIRSEIYMFRKYLELYLEMKEDKKTGLRQLYSLSQDGVKTRAIKLENTMNNVNWMYIPIDEFIMMTAIKEIVNNILYDIESIERNTNIADINEDFAILWDLTEVWRDYNKDLIDIESRLEEII